MGVNLKDHFLKALESVPDFSEAHFQLGIIYEEEDNLEQAESHYMSAIKADEKQANSLESRGEELIKKSQFQHAKEQFIKSQERKDSGARAYLNLAKLYESKSKFTPAIDCLEKSISLSPSAQAHCSLGVLFVIEKKKDAARLHLDKAIGLNYADAIAHYNMGKLLVSDKDDLEAEQHFLSALDIDSEFEECMLDLALLKLNLGDPIEAKSLYERAKNISPEIHHEKLEEII